jgi:predicted ATPase
VRMGLHTGTPLRTDEGYVGMDVHRAARIAAAGHGGQVLISSTTAALVGGADDDDLSLTDLGEHRLKDLAAAERLYQLGNEQHPTLKTLSPSNVPEPVGPLFGRETELKQLADLLGDPAIRLVTLVGPGGLGKTRLALEAAATAASQFPDGRWWVPLASVRDPALLAPLIGEALGLPETVGPPGISQHLKDRRVLLIVDNAEHLQPAISDTVADLLPAGGRSAVLITSREPLKLAAERVLRLPVLSDADAEQLLIERAAALGATVSRSDALTDLVRRLDRLPLALQLAASRLPVLSVEQVLERLSQRLDVLAGPRDSDPRQRTLRAAIEWSHDLLSDPERTLFRRMSVFAGGCTLEAAEAVCDAEIDLLHSLVDRSLIQREDEPGSPPRFGMLDSIGQFAAERLAESAEESEIRSRHATWFRELAERVDAQLRRGEPEERWVRLLTPEIDNLRAAFDFGLQADDSQLVRAIAASLPMFWVMRGHVAEGRSWLERALELDPNDDDMRRRLFGGLAVLAYMQGDYAAATVAADNASDLAARLGPQVGRYTSLREKARAAMMHDDFVAAEPLYLEALEAARDDDNGVGMSSCRINLAYIANRTGRHDRAEELLAENLPFVRSRGQARCEATSLVSLVETLSYLERPAEAIDFAVAAAEVAPRAADPLLLVENLRWYGLAAARLGESERTARILGVCEQAEKEMDAPLEPHEELLREELLAALRHVLTDERLEAERTLGRTLGLAAGTELLAPIAPPNPST